MLLLLFLPLVTLGLGLFFAFMLNVGGRRRKNAAVTGVRGSAFYKIVFFFPQVLSIAIVALLFQFAYNPRQRRCSTASSRRIGLDASQPEWLGDPKLALWCLMAVMVWSNVGFYVVLFSAGMSSIPKDFYEAALLDGANRVKTFFRITLPLLWDTVQTGWIYMGILALGRRSPGRPDHDGRPRAVPTDSTEVLPLYVYRRPSATARPDTRQRSVSSCSIVTLVFVAVVSCGLGRRERLEY